MLKSFFLRAVAVTMALALLPFAGKSQSEPYDVKEPDACVLNFSVLSDCHIEGNNFLRYRLFSQELQDVEKNRSGHDAVLFLGDSTMNGQFFESLLFHGTVRSVLKDETILPVVGNHDVGNGEGDYGKLQNRWYDFTAAFFGRIPCFFRVDRM